MKEYSREYWEALDRCFRAKLPLLEWKPFRPLKVFPLGLHWATVYRLSTDQVQFWIAENREDALANAAAVANEVRSEFSERYARPF